MSTASHSPAAARLPAPMTVVDMVWPDQSNHHGTLFGGAALAMLDRLAFIQGSKALRGSVVTAAVGQLDFKAPAPAGHLVECHAAVVRAGRRSVTVATQLVAEDLLSGRRTDCLRGEFVMVRQADADGDALASGDGSPAANPEATADDTEASTTIAEIVFPGHANHRGVVHGGPAMEWMAKAGFVAATRRVRRTVVLAASERLDFRAPAHVGDIVEVIARVSRLGNRSVDVDVQMWAECPSTGERRCCTQVKLVYVAVEADS